MPQCGHVKLVGYEYSEEIEREEFGSGTVWRLRKVKCMVCGEIIRVKD